MEIGKYSCKATVLTVKERVIFEITSLKLNFLEYGFTVVLCSCHVKMTVILRDGNVTFCFVQFSSSDFELCISVQHYQCLNESGEAWLSSPKIHRLLVVITSSVKLKLWELWHGMSVPFNLYKLNPLYLKISCLLTVLTQ